MQAALLTLLLIPAAPVPKDSQPDREATWKILLECSKSDNPFTRAYTVKTMAKLNHKDFIPKLKEFCADPDAKVRFEAFLAMIKLNAVDNTCLATLRQLAQEVKADREILKGIDFNHIYVAIWQNPRNCKPLAVFLREQYDEQPSGLRDHLIGAWAQYAFHEPGALEKSLKQLRVYNPAKAGVVERDAVLLFTLALRTLELPPKAAIEELERWLVPGFHYWPYMARVETMLKFEPKNHKAHETMMSSCRTFNPRSPVECWGLRDSMKLAVHNPETFATMVETAFDPELFDGTRAELFRFLGQQGKLSHRYLPALERLTQSVKPLLKYAAIEAVVRLKPETREKYIPAILEGLKQRDANHYQAALQTLVALKLQSRDLIAHLELVMQSEPVNSELSLAFATALASINPDNEALFKWTEARVKEYDWNTPLPIELFKNLGHRARKFAPAVIEWMKPREEYYPNPDVVEMIEAITR